MLCVVTKPSFSYLQLLYFNDCAGSQSQQACISLLHLLLRLCILDEESALVKSPRMKDYLTQGSKRCGNPAKNHHLKVLILTQSSSFLHPRLTIRGIKRNLATLRVFLFEKLKNLWRICSSISFRALAPRQGFDHKPGG